MQLARSYPNPSVTGLKGMIMHTTIVSSYATPIASVIEEKLASFLLKNTLVLLIFCK